jgi:hypothetical protein
VSWLDQGLIMSNEHFNDPGVVFAIIEACLITFVGLFLAVNEWLVRRRPIPAQSNRSAAHSPASGEPGQSEAGPARWIANARATSAKS